MKHLALLALLLSLPLPQVALAAPKSDKGRAAQVQRAARSARPPARPAQQQRSLRTMRQPRDGRFQQARPQNVQRARQQNVQRAQQRNIQRSQQRSARANNARNANARRQARVETVNRTPRRDRGQVASPSSSTLARVEQRNLAQQREAGRRWRDRDNDGDVDRNDWRGRRRDRDGDGDIDRNDRRRRDRDGDGDIDRNDRRGWRDRDGDGNVDRRDWRNRRHDRRWWRNNYSRFALFGGGYYYLNSGYWYPAYGYDPYFNYSYNAPLYAYNDQSPGEIIADVQAALQEAGYYRGTVDGDYGPRTRSALLGFQRDNGLPASGQIDEATLRALGFE